MRKGWFDQLPQFALLKFRHDPAGLGEALQLLDSLQQLAYQCGAGSPFALCIEPIEDLLAIAQG